jgi:3-hydroxy-9,10-secoandrosta-1,3,5(10)-triene-9,17-dione monooxygenase
MLFRDSPMTRFWLDLTAARGHIANDPVTPNNILGGMLIGQG